MNYRIAYLANGVRSTFNVRAAHAAAAVALTSDQCARRNVAFELISVQLRSDLADRPSTANARRPASLR